MTALFIALAIYIIGMPIARMSLIGKKWKDWQHNYDWKLSVKKWPHLWRFDPEQQIQEIKENTEYLYKMANIEMVMSWFAVLFNGLKLKWRLPCDDINEVYVDMALERSQEEINQQEGVADRSRAIADMQLLNESLLAQRREKKSKMILRTFSND